jgi:hypothetical protein
MQQSHWFAPIAKIAKRTVNKRTSIGFAATLLLLSAVAFYAYQHWAGDPGAGRASTLAAMPAGATAVVFADFAELRQSTFAARLYAWVPRPQIDADYAQFLRDTGFDYERDLDRVAIAALKRGPDTTFFAVADGRFDREKITAYASPSGSRETRDGHEIFSVSPTPPSSPATAGSPRKISFTFLRKDRMALTDGSDLAALLSLPSSAQDAKEWRERFARLAGSPVFAVIRQDAAPGSALASRAPGGLRAPELSVLLDQLRWITIAGKPESDGLRVVTEGEGSADTAARQLADMLNGVLLMAEAGLNGPQVRQQLDPQARDAYLEMLKGTEISRIDRGETKSVRLVFDLTPKFLEAARTRVPSVVPSVIPSVVPSVPPPTSPPRAKTSRHK